MRLDRLHPVTRLALALPVMALLPVGGPLALALGLAGCVAAALAAGRAAIVLRRLVLVLLPVALALIVVHGLLIARGPSMALGPLLLYPEGAAYAGTVLLRLALLLAAGLLIVGTTPPGLLADGLEDKGLAPALAYLLTAPLSLGAQIAQEAAAIRDALQVRGLPLSGALRDGARALPRILSALIRTQLVEAGARAQMLEARGFRSRPRRTLLSPPPDSNGQRRLRLACVASAVLILAGGLWG